MKLPDILIKEKFPRNIFGESERQTVLVESYSQRQIEENFFKLHYKSLPLIVKMRDCFPLYLYMCKNITRKKSKYLFWNNKIIPYFKQGYLPFAKHQDNIASDLGVSQSSISAYLKMLRDHDLIAKLGKERYTDNRMMDVWSMGKWIEDDMGQRYEVYYLQAITFD